jgi:hypothetical protein
MWSFYRDFGLTIGADALVWDIRFAPVTDGAAKFIAMPYRRLLARGGAKAIPIRLVGFKVDEGDLWTQIF